MFPKSVSGTSGDLRENKGNAMTEAHDSELRRRFFLLGKLTNVESDTGNPVQWGQVRIKCLEQHLQELLVDIKKLELENESLSKTVLTLSAPPMLTSLESDEEIHQQRRRERMLDEITLSSVRGFLHLHAEEKTYREIGVSARDRAEDICRGIDEFDAR